MVYESTRKAKEHVRNGGEPKSHGLSGYNYWGCRCDVCVKANREREAAKRPNKKKYSKAEIKQRKTERDRTEWSQNLTFPEV